MKIKLLFKIFTITFTLFSVDVMAYCNSDFECKGSRVCVEGRCEYDRSQTTHTTTSAYSSKKPPQGAIKFHPLITIVAAAVASQAGMSALLLPIELEVTLSKDISFSTIFTIGSINDGYDQYGVFGMSLGPRIFTNGQALNGFYINPIGLKFLGGAGGTSADMSSGIGFQFAQDGFVFDLGAGVNWVSMFNSSPTSFYISIPIGFHW